MYGSECRVSVIFLSRFLGVLVDSSLSFEDHCEMTVNKANRVLGVVRRSFKYIDRETMPTLFKALIRPHLEYGNTIWCPKLKTSYQFFGSSSAESNVNGTRPSSPSL